MRRLLVYLFLVAAASAGALSVSLSPAAAADPLSQVAVRGGAGQKPTVRFAKPFSVAASEHRVVVTGKGGALGQGTKVTIDYLVLDGRSGKQIGSTYGSRPATAVLDPSQTTPAVVDGLVGAPVGSRVLVAVSPADGLNAQLASVGVKKNDSLLFVITVRGVRHPLTRATGTPVAPAAGLPAVTLDATGKPQIATPTGKAPSSLVVQPLIKGDGSVVRKGQTVTVNYTGVVWGTGKQFDSSWDRGTPADFPIGVGQVIKGWDEAIVGQHVGSQLLVVVPPAKGYGSAGNPQAGIGGADTLVFVVDILDAY